MKYHTVNCAVNTEMVTNVILGINDQYQSLIKDLYRLPCFVKENIKGVVVIDSGLSQPCFRVQGDKQAYFAKYLTNGNAEILANTLAANYGVAPKLVYGKGDWLISEFICGELLRHCDMDPDEQLVTMLSLLAQCHRLPLSFNKYPELAQTTPDAVLTIPPLAIEQTITQLVQAVFPNQAEIENHQLSLSQCDSLMLIVNSALQELAQLGYETGQGEEVFCHGDANFSNVIKLESEAISDVKSHYQLLDFGCACIAPIEYDIAMLMAVNEIENKKIEQVIRQYSQQQYLQSHQKAYANNQQQSQAKIVDNLQVKSLLADKNSITTVTRYYCLSLIINGLWYLSQYQQRKLEKYRRLANKQFSLLTIQYPEVIITLK